MEFIEFKSICENNKCPRYYKVSKTCIKQYRQEQCYRKYIDKKNKIIEKDTSYKEFTKQVWLKYAGFFDGCVYARKDWQDICMLWKCLTPEEKQYILINFDKEDLKLNEQITVAHIDGRQGKNKLDVDNTVLIAMLWHRLLDDFKDPITRKCISKEQRIAWFERIKTNFKEN